MQRAKQKARLRLEDDIKKDTSRKTLSAEEGRKRSMVDIPQDVTTVAVRNVPWNYTQEDLVEAWPPTDCYDYLHLPRDSRGNRTTTYAFVNFISREKAQEFAERWHGRFMPDHQAPTSLSIAVANTQGLEENMARVTARQLKEMAAQQVLPATFCHNIPIDCRLLYIALGLGTPEELLDTETGTDDAETGIKKKAPAGVFAKVLTLADAKPAQQGEGAREKPTLVEKPIFDEKAIPLEKPILVEKLEFSLMEPGRLDTLPAETTEEVPMPEKVPVPNLCMEMLLSV